MNIRPYLDWRPDIVHVHDWHASPAILWLATGAARDERYRAIPTVLTIHNLLHQGRADEARTEFRRAAGLTRNVRGLEARVLNQVGR